MEGLRLRGPFLTIQRGEGGPPAPPPLLPPLPKWPHPLADPGQGRGRRNLEVTPNSGLPLCKEENHSLERADPPALNPLLSFAFLSLVADLYPHPQGKTSLFLLNKPITHVRPGITHQLQGPVRGEKSWRGAQRAGGQLGRGSSCPPRPLLAANPPSETLLSL